MSNAARLSQHRANWERSLDTTAVVTHITRVPDAAGGFTETTTTASYPCRVQPVSLQSRERAQGGTVVALHQFDLGLPWDAVVAATDTIAANGEVFRVDDVDTGRSLNYGLVANCTRVS